LYFLINLSKNTFLICIFGDIWVIVTHF
jgi:hypothetical protein